MKAKKKTNKKKSTKKTNSKSLIKKGIGSKIKELFFKVKDKFLEFYEPYMLWLSLPFVLMDVFTYIFGLNINYTNSILIFIFSFLLIL